MPKINQPIAIVLAASITAFATAIVTPVVARFLESDPAQKVTDEVQIAQDTPSGAIPDSGFGTWVTAGFKTSVVYTADSDGFVSAWTGGNRPPRGADILSGPSQTALSTCTRIDGSYAGGICPVRKGEKWIVKSRGGSSGVSIKWMPISP